MVNKVKTKNIPKLYLDIRIMLSSSSCATSVALIKRVLTSVGVVTATGLSECDDKFTRSFTAYEFIQCLDLVPWSERWNDSWIILSKLSTSSLNPHQAVSKYFLY